MVRHTLGGGLSVWASWGLVGCLFTSVWVCGCLGSAWALSPQGGAVQEPQLDLDPVLKPQAAPKSKGQTPPAPSGKKLVLSGTVSLEAAMAAEQGQVDWYGWYMACREYLKTTGGFNCPVGTPLVFYKNGQIRAQSPFPTCARSAMVKHYPLPHNTQVEAIVLKARSGTAPPASPQELMEMLKNAY